MSIEFKSGGGAVSTLRLVSLPLVHHELLLVLLLGLTLQLWINLAGERVRAQRSPEEKYMGLRSVGATMSEVE